MIENSINLHFFVLNCNKRISISVLFHWPNLIALTKFDLELCIVVMVLKCVIWDSKIEKTSFPIKDKKTNYFKEQNKSCLNINHSLIENHWFSIYSTDVPNGTPQYDQRTLDKIELFHYSPKANFRFEFQLSFVLNYVFFQTKNLF